MEPKEGLTELQQILRFWPWPPGDSYSPWVLKQLDTNTLIRLQAVALELDHAILTANLKANVQRQEILKGFKQ